MAEIQFEWNESNTDHIARHGVTPVEAEEVIAGDPLVLEVQFRNGEQRVLSAGRTAFPAKRSLREGL